MCSSWAEMEEEEVMVNWICELTVNMMIYRNLQLLELQEMFADTITKSNTHTTLIQIAKEFTACKCIF